MNHRHDTTIAKINKIKSLGYEVIEKWECDFRRELSSSDELCNFVTNHPLLKNLPLDPRDAFYGGRTGNIVEYYKAGDGEQIKYVDVCSLYPWVCKYGKFPVGHSKYSLVRRLLFCHFPLSQASLNVRFSHLKIFFILFYHRK